MGWTVRYDLPTHTAGGNTCYICRAGQRQDHTGQMEAMLDPNIHIEFEGWMLVCASCITEAAHELGLPTESLRHRLQEQIDKLSAKLDETQIRADAAETALDALRRYDLVKPEGVYVADPSPGPGLSVVTGYPVVERKELDEGAGASSGRSPRGRGGRW